MKFSLTAVYNSIFRHNLGQRQTEDHDARLARLAPNIRALDLSAVIYLLIVKDGLSEKAAYEAVVSLKECLHLHVLHPKIPLAPTPCAEIAWHSWLTLPLLYALQTTQLLGYVLDHDPYAGLRGDIEPQRQRIQNSRKLLAGLSSGSHVVPQVRRT